MAKKKLDARLVSLYAGVEILGSNMTIHHKMASLEVTPLGVLAVSRKTGKNVLIPFANIKAVELFPGQDSDSD